MIKFKKVFKKVKSFFTGLISDEFKQQLSDELEDKGLFEIIVVACVLIITACSVLIAYCTFASY